MQPAETRTVIYGKHPSFGDFLVHGLPRAVSDQLDVWLERELPKVKAALGDAWEAAWASAPPLYMWIGPSVLGLPVMGVFRASQDKVGRRFPLMFGVAGLVTPPPLHPAYDASPYASLLAHIDHVRPAQPGARALLEGFEAPAMAGAAWAENEQATLWAQRGDGNLARLFEDARTVDAEQAQLGRSHWWQTAQPDQEAGWLGANGLPNAEGLTWLLSGRVRTAPDPVQDAQEIDEALDVVETQDE